MNGLSIEPDLRGQHGNLPGKLLPEAREKMVRFLCAQKAYEPHYTRTRRRRKYFDSHVSLRQLWLAFIRENPYFQATRRSVNKKGRAPVSYLTFRKVFNEELRDFLSFRKPRVDTCQTCDANQKKLDRLRSAPRHNEELRLLIDEYNTHLLESEIRFASLKYDVNILATKTVRDDNH